MPPRQLSVEYLLGGEPILRHLVTGPVEQMTACKWIAAGPPIAGDEPVDRGYALVYGHCGATQKIICHA